MEQLELFMKAIMTLESGGNYNAMGPPTRYGRARGAYQILESNYPSWARAAGVSPSDWSPAAQDKVARYQMTKYFQQYGSWDLVAVAWFAGPGAANKAQAQGIHSVGNRSDVLGTSVTQYVQKINEYMGNPGAQTGPAGGGGGGGQPAGGGPATGNAAPQPGAEQLNIPDGGSWIRVGGQIYVAFRFSGVDGGPTSVVFYRHPEGPPPGTKVSNISEEDFARWKASGQWVDGGSTEAFRGVEAGKTYQQLVDDTLMQLGLYGTDALSDQGVMNIIALAMSRELSPEELQSRLRQTDWWKNRTDSQREWSSLSPAEQEKRIVDEAMKLAGLYFTYTGVDLDLASFDRDGDGVISASELKKALPDLYQWAVRVASGEVTQAQAVNVWIKDVAKEDPNSPWSRTLREEEQARGQFDVDKSNMAAQIQDLYHEWGLPITKEQAMDMAEDVVMNRMSLGDVRNELMDQAEALYPHKPRHISTRQWATPYMNVYQSTLEVPEVGLDDPTLQRALTDGVTLADFNRSLRNDDRWLGTDNARNEMNTKVSELGRVMGF